MKREIDIAKEIGIDIRELRKAREIYLAEGNDFERDEKTRAICYTPEAEKWIIEQLKKPAALIISTPENPPPAPEPAQEEPKREDTRTPAPVEKGDTGPTLATVNMFYKRRDIVGATVNGKQVVVRIPGNSRDKFIRGLQIPVRLFNVDVYELAGLPPAKRGRNVR